MIFGFWLLSLPTSSLFFFFPTTFSSWSSVSRLRIPLVSALEHCPSPGKESFPPLSASSPLLQHF
jgi:hypothetical protein